ncbi:MAG: hypothetical protein QOE33_1110 [Acidobacteriota bacterium]|nr:hypothetical protein [Acidobacteriota bacterium]
MRKIFLTCSLVALFALGAFAQGQQSPTLRVVTEDPTLPSELFYGNVKVKPVRLRPGTNTRITIDDSDFFVQQQYIDFLSRFPDQQGFNDWMSALNSCSGDPACLDGPNGKRVQVSRNFFLSTEFQIKGYYAFRFYKASFGRLPSYDEMIGDMRAVTGTTTAEVRQKKAAYATSFASRGDFQAAYGSFSNAAYVAALMNRYNLSSISTIDPQNPDAGLQVTLTTADLTNQLNAGTLDRAKVLRAVVDSTQVQQTEFNSGFVGMQYYGYLRRAPEPGGYNDWLTYLNSHPGDFNTMVYGFAYSTEYRNRF